MSKNITIRQNILGGYVPFFPSNVSWTDNFEAYPPLLVNDFATYNFVTADGGTTWVGVQLNQPIIPLVFDRFTRANSTTLLGIAEAGGSWVAHAGTWGITGNTAYLVTRVGDSVASLDTGTANHSVFVDVTPGNSLGQPALVGRCSDASNYWLLLPSQQGASPQSAALWKNVAGVFTNIANVNLPANAQYVIGQPTRFGLVFSGNTITAYVNGTQVATTTDAALNTNTRVGLRQNDANPGMSWDNLVAF